MKHKKERVSRQLIYTLIITISIVSLVILITNLSKYYLGYIKYIMLFIIIILFILISISTIYISKNKKNKKQEGFIGKFLLKISLNMTLPFYIRINKVLGKDKDYLRRLYIEANNRSLGKNKKNSKGKDILLIVPHCMQNSECEIRLTNDINRCNKCGKCDIKMVCELIEKYNIKAQLVTGGTAARNIVLKLRPSMVLAIACERDLVSGIEEARKFKILGQLNLRPFGPCYNTRVNLAELEEKIKSILTTDDVKK